MKLKDFKEDNSQTSHRNTCALYWDCLSQTCRTGPLDSGSHFEEVYREDDVKQLPLFFSAHLCEIKYIPTKRGQKDVRCWWMTHLCLQCCLSTFE